MKRVLNFVSPGITVSIMAVVFGAFYVSCKEVENPIKYKRGIFNDSVTVALDGINSAYDDYNMSLYTLEGSNILVFSSNRNSAGGQFDLVQGRLTYCFDQTNGLFNLETNIHNDPFTSSLIEKANTMGEDLGPNRFFSSVDGYEYLILSSETENGDLDMFYLKNMPAYGTAIPEITGPNPVTRLNTAANEGYFSFNFARDTAYFCSDIDGNFNIYMIKCDEKSSISSWLESDYETPIKVDSVNSDYNDKTPFVYYRAMVFSSDRPGGIGGYDLYYSIFKDGNWGAPINFGPSVNTEYNEYRPIIGFNSSYTNKFMIFSSDRPGGKGGYDLYFRGVSFDY